MSCCVARKKDVRLAHNLVAQIWVKRRTHERDGPVSGRLDDVDPVDAARESRRVDTSDRESSSRSSGRRGSRENVGPDNVEQVGQLRASLQCEGNMDSLECEPKYLLGKLAILGETLNKGSSSRTCDRLKTETEDTGKFAIDNVVEGRASGERQRLLSVVGDTDNVRYEGTYEKRERIVSLVRIVENDD